MGTSPGDTTACLLPADVDECVGEENCAPHGECLNSQGSFFCLCAPGFASAEGGTSCQGEKPAWLCPLASSRGRYRLCLEYRDQVPLGPRREPGLRKGPFHQGLSATPTAGTRTPNSFECHPSFLYRASRSLASGFQPFPTLSHSLALLEAA